MKRKLIASIIITLPLAVIITAFLHVSRFERDVVRVINAHAAAIDDHAKSLRITGYLLSGGTNRTGQILRWDSTHVISTFTNNDIPRFRELTNISKRP